MENQNFKVIVAGGRDFFDYTLLSKKLDAILSKKEHIIIVSGMAKGADSLCERYAREHNFLLSHFPALCNQHGTLKEPFLHQL